LDTTFGPAGSAGVVTESILPFTSATAITLVNNQILIGGNGFNSSSHTSLGFVTRYGADGLLDPSFGGSGTGTAVVTFGGTGTQPTFSSLAADSTGRIVVAGGLASSSGLQFRLVRLNADGTADASFGTVSSTPLSGFVPSAVTVQPDNSALVAGTTTTGSVTAFGVVRFTPSGSIDSTFGQAGGQSINFSQHFDSAQSVVLQPDGSIVLGGFAEFPGTATQEGHTDFALARLTSSGMPDPSFGTNGQVTTTFGTLPSNPTFDDGNAVLIQPDGNIVLAGTSSLGTSQGFALARYLGATAVGTGETRGSKWIEANGDGIRQPGEPGVPGVTVFVDLNRNGRLDTGEPSAVTDANGDYDIPKVPVGTYPVIDESAGTELQLPGDAQANAVDFGFSVAAGAGRIAVGDPQALRLDPATNFPAQLGRVYVFDPQDGQFHAELPAPPPTNTNPLFPNHDAFGFSLAIDSDGDIAVGSPFRWVPFTALSSGEHFLSHGAVFMYRFFDTGHFTVGNDLQTIESQSFQVEAAGLMVEGR
jgi:uncharacterized delta-60 repeat protein